MRGWNGYDNRMWPMTVNLWSQLVAQSGFTPQATGTWTRVSATGPQPPATYNGNISFANVATGSYIYRYSVTNGLCTSTADVTVVWTQIAPRPNDNCLNALQILMPLNYVSGTYQSDGNSISGQCPNKPSATSSANPPPQWGVATVYDLWYRVDLPAPTPPDQSYQFTVFVDGQQYGLAGIESPRLAIYSDCNTLLDAPSPISGQYANSSRVISNAQTILIRVGGIDLNRSNFSIIISI